ncbi:MAG: hybrid sensor histidine kinase/response regulator, partial [Okeania sp. SIO3C4]|nr:hybrid sensor histidine kinase/response regulator [Okeania sp. SIO3C4]
SRAVRDISMECGKEVDLQVEGKETLIDKMIQDKLSDPMKHLINNAITHGVETPQQRLAAGKSSKGQITIRAFHQGNQTVISVADNGAGINPEKVKKKAIEKGLITQKQAQGMNNIDVYDLLFHPGFSTKDKADNFSGRGVGLDVVKTNLTEIRGTISIDSTIGKGTMFTIRLPLTLSISKALCCISDRSWIAFPMDGVEDMIKVSKEEVKAEENGQYYIEWRGSKLPFRHLRELLVYNRHLRRGNVYGINAEEDMISIVVLRSASAGIFLAVQVDQVLEQQKEIVIKQLEGPIPKPIGIAGATVLGDGNIVAIADVIELINLATGRLRRDESNIWSSSEEGEASLPVQQKSELTVLIVDDSITVRELLSMTFSKAGYRVEQARDGKDAWEKMRAGLPCDLVFCDIEMPRMDGFELLSRMQKDSNLNTLPVAMLTSRGAKKHMEMAFELGAKGYFTKPYIEEKLLEGAVSILEGKSVGDIFSGAGH